MRVHRTATLPVIFLVGWLLHLFHIQPFLLFSRSTFLALNTDELNQTDQTDEIDEINEIGQTDEIDEMCQMLRPDPKRSQDEFQKLNERTEKIGGMLGNIIK